MITAEERRAQIDRDFDSSIGVFDGRLRKEQQVLAESRGNGRGGSASGAGESATTAGANPAGTAGANGDKNGSAGKSSTTGNGKDNGNAGGGGAANSAGHNSNGTGNINTGNGAGGGMKGGAGPAAIPTDVPDGHDDDIVARQLREAAMKETDAELRDRLWQEYRDYKKNSKG